MNSDVVQKLSNLNREFYQSFGSAFAETRRRIQPGVARALDEWIRDGDWLDIGCGSGTLAQSWLQRGFKGSYTGVDFSIPLLQEATGGLRNSGVPASLVLRFTRADLLTAGWDSEFVPASMDGILAFAVLHHIPGADIRKKLLVTLSRLIKPGGLFIHSEWQFRNSPKLMARVQPWSLAGLTDEQVEPGDALLDWRHHVTNSAGAPGLRYVHLFTGGELADLADCSGFDITAEFHSDGVGEKLGLYQVWRKR